MRRDSYLINLYAESGSGLRWDEEMKDGVRT